MSMRSSLAGKVNEDNHQWFTLIAACFALFMAILDNLVVNVALPTISRDLDASTTQLQWIVSSYILVFASLQITAGGLGDRLGRKKWFLLGIAFFTGSSIFAALSQNVEMLILARALQGLGAAFILPLSLSLVSNAFPPEERGKALGIWSAVSVSGLALGPVVGGLLVQYVSWHWIFLINVPIGILAIIVTQAVVTESKDTTGEVATDIPGTLLVTGAIASLVYGLIEAGNRGWNDTLILGAFALAAVLAAAFVWVESRTAKPMVPLRFFKSSTFTGANMDAFAISFLIAGLAFFGTLYLQNVLGFSPVRAGMALIPMVIVMMFGAPLSGSLVNRVGARSLISFGMIVSGIGTLLYTRADINGSYWDLLPSYLVMGLGFSFIFAPMTTAVMNSVEAERSGVASAVNGAIREIGNAFGIAFLGTIMNRTYQDAFNTDPAVQGLRETQGSNVVGAVIAHISNGMSQGGHVIDSFVKSGAFPGLDQFPQAIATIRLASGNAFMEGMDRAIYVSAFTIMAVAVLSFFLVKDSVAAGVERPAEPTELELEYEQAAD